LNISCNYCYLNKGKKSVVWDYEGVIKDLEKIFTENVVFMF